MYNKKVIDPLYKNGKEFSVRVYTPATESQYLTVIISFSSNNLDNISILDKECT